MKKIMMAIVAMFMITASGWAQQSMDDKHPHKQYNATEAAQKATSQMVKKYGLTDKQAKKLKSLNEKYAKDMGPQFMRVAGGQTPPNGKGLKKGDRLNGEKPNAPQMDGQKKGNDDAADKAPKARPEGKPGMKPQDGQGPRGPHMQGHRQENKEFQAKREAYETKLKKILGDEKFAKYKSEKYQPRKRVKPNKN